MGGLSGARCVGQHELFESIELADHQQARELCIGCPALEACAALLREVQTVTNAVRRCGGGPAGTWAGVLVGASDRDRRGRTNPREHGTERGYHQHRWLQETTCRECRAAHAKTVAAPKSAAS